MFSSEGETGRGALLRSPSAAIDRLAGKGGGGGGTTDLLLVLGGGGGGGEKGPGGKYDSIAQDSSVGKLRARRSS